MFDSQSLIPVVIASVLGLGLVIASALVFYRFSWKGLYLFVPLALVAGLLLYRVNPEYFASFMGAVIIGGTAGMVFRGEGDFQRYLLTATLAVTVVFSGNYFAMKAFRGLDLFEESKSRFMEYVESSEMPEENRKELVTRIASSGSVLRDIVPYSYFLNALLFVSVSFFVLRHIVRRFSGREMTDGKGIEHFRLNDYFIFTVILGWLGFMLADETAHYPVYAASLNIALIFSTLYVVQALGIIKFFLIKKGLPLFILPLILFVIVSLFMEMIVFFLIIFAGIGAIDFWADFRKLEAVKNDGA